MQKERRVSRVEREQLLALAREAALRAYAPYSRFRVGVAVVVETPEGPRVVSGANVENASLGLTLCAERAALSAACLVAGGRDTSHEREIIRQKPRITQVALACIDAAPDAPVSQRTPCGACRQWLAELAPDAVYYVDGITRDLRLDDLLPLAFRLEEEHF